jgi:hypothetical protein
MLKRKAKKRITALDKTILTVDLGTSDVRGTLITVGGQVLSWGEPLFGHSGIGEFSAYL